MKRLHMRRFFSFAGVLVLFFCGTAFSVIKPVTSGQATTANVYANSEASVYASSEADVSYGNMISMFGGTPTEDITERIDYAYKVVDNYVNPLGIPAYLSSYTCGISAGGVAVGYYDRFYEELIPNHTGKYFLGDFLYGSQGTEVNNMFSSLYNAMGANPQGVTIDQYKSGFGSYASSKGRTASFTSAMGGTSQLNTSQYKSAIKNGKLLSIFLDGFTIIDSSSIQTYDKYDIVRVFASSGLHIMMAYGYHEISYYNSANHCFRKDSYLYVTSGFSVPVKCLVKLNQYCVIDDCYVTDIY